MTKEKGIQKKKRRSGSDGNGGWGILVAYCYPAIQLSGYPGLTTQPTTYQRQAGRKAEEIKVHAPQMK